MAPALALHHFHPTSTTTFVFISPHASSLAARLRRGTASVSETLDHDLIVSLTLKQRGREGETPFVPSTQEVHGQSFDFSLVSLFQHTAVSLSWSQLLRHALPEVSSWLGTLGESEIDRYL